MGSSYLTVILLASISPFTLTSPITLSSFWAWIALVPIPTPVLFVITCVAAAPTKGRPPTVVPSWTTAISRVVSIVNSPSAPVNIACSAVVPLLSCTCLVIVLYDSNLLFLLIYLSDNKSNDYNISSWNLEWIIYSNSRYLFNINCT